MNGSQAYLNARVSAMVPRLLSQEDMLALVAAPLEDIGRRFELSSILTEPMPHRLKNRAIERALIRALLSDLMVLIRPMTGPARELTRYWAGKFDLYNLKALIRGKLNGLDAAEIRDNLYDLPPGMGLPLQQLLNTENIQELLRLLEQGTYSAIARQGRKVFEEHHDPFILEATIDQRYYAGLLSRSRGSQGADQKDLHQLIGALLDQLNLQWVVRYRFSYLLSPSETFYQLVPSTRLMNRERLLALVNESSFERVLESLPAPLDERLAGADDAPELERRLDVITTDQALSILNYGSSAVGRALAYLVLREIGLKKLFALIQGKVLGLDPDIVGYAIGQAQDTSPATAST